MTDTPRTDAQDGHPAIWHGETSDEKFEILYDAMTNHARALERELAEERQRTAFLELNSTKASIKLIDAGIAAFGTNEEAIGLLAGKRDEIAAYAVALEKAVEFAEHLGTTATRFMDAINAVDEARERHEEAEPGADAAAAYDVMYAAEEIRSDLWSTLRDAIYEFEKRRDRAALAKNGEAGEPLGNRHVGANNPYPAGSAATPNVTSGAPATPPEATPVGEGRPAAPSPLGDLADVLTEYDGIVDRADRDDPEWDFVMRASDYRALRDAIRGTEAALFTKADVEHLCAIAVAAGRSKPVIDKMVDRFLAWRLPKDFGPDAGITFKPSSHPHGWPTGTNLFTADQAKAMFEYVTTDPLDVMKRVMDGPHEAVQGEGLSVDLVHDSNPKGVTWGPAVLEPTYQDCLDIYTLEDLATWLDRKYQRHGEHCDRLAAKAIRDFRAALETRPEGVALRKEAP